MTAVTDIFFKSNLTLSRHLPKKTTLPSKTVDEVRKRVETLESRVNLQAQRSRNQRRWTYRSLIYITYIFLTFVIAVGLYVTGKTRWIFAQLLSLVPVTYFLVDSDEVKFNIFIICISPVALVFHAVMDQIHPCKVRKLWDDDLMAVCDDMSTPSVKLRYIRRLRVEDSCIRFIQDAST